MILRLYRALTRLLPRQVRERDAEDMVRALADQFADARSPMMVTVRALVRFPAVLALEWRDAVWPWRAPLYPPSSRGQGMDAFARTVRQGVRGLLRTPAFSLSVVLLLGAGVGSVSAVFAVVDHVLLRPLPYPHADRLVVVGGSQSLPAMRDLQSMHAVDTWVAGATDNAPPH
jgi:hypothetical protein